MRVSDVQWNSSWEIIAILYANGHVLVGNAEGSLRAPCLAKAHFVLTLGKQYWKKDLGIPATSVTWFPDGRAIVACDTKNTCHALDLKGDFISKFSFSYHVHECFPEFDHLIFSFTGLGTIEKW